MQTTERISDEHCMLHLSRYHAYQWIVLERFWRLSAARRRHWEAVFEIAILSVFKKFGEI
jgi:hypothetical protein